ncbi:methyl-accepting chemotaxis protein [Pseudomonas sp. F1_0610]|uniref:methyl-accepting chemotaxis protein n=1 Tax=Pseudomonas sp. F1_0610 TaxID=3114284 RepID=UPI0039C2E9B3
MNNSKGNFLGIGSGAWIGMLFVLLLVSIALLFLNFFYLNKQSNYDKEYIAHAGELRVLSQRVAKNAALSVTGNVSAFQELKSDQKLMESHIKILQEGDNVSGLEPVSGIPSEAMRVVEKQWTQVDKGISSITTREQTIVQLEEKSSAILRAIPEIQAQYAEVVDIMVQNQDPAAQIAIAERQSLLVERIGGSLLGIMRADENSVELTDRFASDVSRFSRVLKGMREGDVNMQINRVTDPRAVARLQKIDELFIPVSDSVQGLLIESPEIFQVRGVEATIAEQTKQMLNSTKELALKFEEQSGERVIYTYAGYVLGLIAFISVVFMGWVSTREARFRLRETRDANERNQTAILRLLDEIGDLADGDLTSQATVTEDFTGAIADSINYAIDQLRDLVGTINDTAVQVSTAAQETQSTAMHLAEASEHQAQEIAGASAAITEMARSIDHVSANAAESANVAKQSVELANKGNQLVHNTIKGMDNIRDQIQDTSKRIKRLGESSQEIGDIVGLINDIADQTNILSLNAAIQASMAGDAGRGFAVVADEVQRLAERSSSATKQIEALVKTIQTDTNEAVMSMEQTTTEVVRGARLAVDAGVSLEEIERVSKVLSDLIQNISQAARQQASSASHVSNTMNVIQEITSQTSAGTTATAHSIGNLAKMAVAMRESVSGFTLPN